MEYLFSSVTLRNVKNAEVSNERVWVIANIKCELLRTVKNRKMMFLGHILAETA